MKKALCVIVCMFTMIVFAGASLAEDKPQKQEEQVQVNQEEFDAANLGKLMAYRETGESHKCGFRDAQCYEVKCDSGKKFYYYYNSSKGQYCTGTSFESCMSDLGKLLKFYCGE